MTVLVVLIVIAIVVGVPALVDMVRRSDLRNMAVRNAVRRPLETLLIIVGSGLGTAIIVAALMVGDTFEASILDFVRRGLGEIDLVAEVESSQDAPRNGRCRARGRLTGNCGRLGITPCAVVYRWRARRRSRTPRLRGLGTQGGQRRHVVDPRRVSEPRRRWSSAL